MISTTDPQCMTTDERRQEVARILANGLLRRIHQAGATLTIVSKTPKNSLDVPAQTRLHVAPRPTG